MKNSTPKEIKEFERGIIKKTPPETSECSFNHQELPNCDVCEKLGCKHILPETPNWEKEFDEVESEIIGILDRDGTCICAIGEIIDKLEKIRQLLQNEREDIKETLLKNGHGGGNWRRIINQL